ncbi:MAG: tetratricopeptide repeat protein, partial [Deltaproteobacteria bacterium]|nr:tetratricopeptide repeat protein [Deltaproteobacteria bacterium]
MLGHSSLAQQAKLHVDIGAILQAQGDVQGALAAYDQAIELVTTKLGPEHPESRARMARVSFNLALLAYRRGELSEARSRLAEVVVVDEPAIAIKARVLAILALPDDAPFERRLAEARALVRTSAANEKLLMVSQNYRFYRAPRAVARLLAEKKFGACDSVALDFRRHGPSMGYAYYDFADPLIADMSIHHFDLMRMVLGSEARRVSCRTWNPAGSPFRHHPSGVATIEFENGVVLSYRGSWMSSGPDTPWSGEWAMNFGQGEILWACRGDAGSDRSKVDWVRTRPLRGEAAPERLEDLPYYDRAGTIAALALAVRDGKIPPWFSSGADNIFSLA